MNWREGIKRFFIIAIILGWEILAWSDAKVEFQVKDRMAPPNYPATICYPYPVLSSESGLYFNSDHDYEPLREQSPEETKKQIKSVNDHFYWHCFKYYNFLYYGVVVPLLFFGLCFAAGWIFAGFKKPKDL